MNESTTRSFGWRRWLPVLKRLLMLLTVLVLVLVLLIAWLGFTSSGLQAGLSLVNRLDAVTIDAMGLEGDLTDLSAAQLTIETTAVRLELKQLHLQTRPLALLKRTLQVDQLTLAQLRVTTQDAQPVPNEPESDEIAEPPLHLRADRIAIDRLLVNDLKPITTVRLALAADRHWQHDVALSAQLPELGELTASLAGNSTSSRAQVGLPAMETSLQIDLGDWLQHLRWQGEFKAGDLSSVGLSGKLTIRGTGDAAQGDLQIDSQLVGHHLVLDSLSYQRPDQTVVLDGSGTLDGAGLTLRAAIGPQGVTDGGLMLTDYQQDPQWHLGEGSVSINGPWQQLAVQLAGVGEIQAEPFELDLAASIVQLSMAQIDQLTALVLGGEVTGQGQVDWSQQLIASGQLSAESLALNHIDSQLPTALSFDMAIDWQPDRLQGELNRVDATIADSQAPVTGAGQFEYLAASGWSGVLELIAGASNQLTLQAPGEKAPISLDLTLASLGNFISGANGSGQANLQIDPTRYLLDGSLLLTDVSIPELATVAELRLNAGVVDGVQQVKLQAAQLDGEAGNDAAAWLKADELMLTLSGDPEQHDFVVDIANADAHDIALSGSGWWRDQSWKFQLDQLSAQLPQLNAIRLREPVEGAIQPDGVAISNACLDSSDLGSVCARLQRTGASLDGAMQIALLDQAPALPVLLSSIGWPALELSNDLNLDAQLRLNGETIEQLKVVGAAPGLRWPSTDGVPLLLSQIKLDADHSDEGLRYQLHAALADGHIDAAGVVVDPMGSATLDGTLQIALPQLAALAPLSEQFDLQQGQLNVDLSVSGSLARPLFNGLLRVDDALVTWPGLGVEHAIELQVQLDQRGHGSLQGEIGSGEGKLTIGGDLQLPIAGESTAALLDIELVGDQFLLADTADLAATASSNLRLSVTDQGWQLLGKVTLDQAFSNLAVPSSGGVVRSPDVVIVDAVQDNSTSAASQQGAIDISVDFASPGKLDGLGLSGEVDGKLRLTQRPGNPLLANGQLTLSGNYRAFGQDLAIDQGELLYVNSPIDEPTIAVLARRVIDEVTVGVRVSGPASALVTKLESEPVMSESDMLHYLVLGRAPDAPSASESDQLSAAAIGMALRRSQDSVSALGQQLGATELGLTQELGGLALAVGKQLSPKLYIGYTVGLLEPIDVAQIRYQINRHWSLQSEIAEETRAGIRYRIEKD